MSWIVFKPGRSIQFHPYCPKACDELRPNHRQLDTSWIMDQTLLTTTQGMQ
jgi:hypothetical protein